LRCAAKDGCAEKITDGHRGLRFGVIEIDVISVRREPERKVTHFVRRNDLCITVAGNVSDPETLQVTVGIYVEDIFRVRRDGDERSLARVCGLGDFKSLKGCDLVSSNECI